ncbi:MAG: SET domain-containing protein-lysine N-methyltransferase [Bacteroidetes bacterium]|nr:SET domain-containing protein-lysine N-methyltransferase [Bacteroidota bacterium]
MIAPFLFTAITENKGWGVFTSTPIKRNQMIEVSPVIVMTAKEKLVLDQTTLYNYIFDWQGDACCMAMGLVPVYNHSYEANCEYFQDYENNTIFIKTVRDIVANEELTINYNGDWNDKKKVWFEVSL